MILDAEGSPRSSGHHAEVVFAGGKWWLQDLESTNGTFLNGTRVTRTALKAGDRVAFADALVTFEPGPRRPDHRLVLWIAAAIALVGIATGYVLLGGDDEPNFEEASAVAARSVYLVAVEGSGQHKAVGTAFAVGEDGLLATNAHVADELQRRGWIGANATEKAVVMQSDSNEVRHVVGVQLHPRWKSGSLANDVALLKVDGGQVTPLPLANAGLLGALHRGVPLATFGFPAASTDTSRPRGRLSVDVLGDVRDGRYLEIDLNIVPGMSGSPIFDGDGQVVGVVAGGDFVAYAGETARPSGSGSNWGVSVSAVRELLAGR